MNVLDVALDVVMFYHFATQNTLIPSVHTPHKGLWKMALVNSFWRNSMGFSEMAEPVMPSFESHTANVTRKIQRQVESFNVLLEISSLWSSLPAFRTLPTLVWHLSWEWRNLLINITIWRRGRVKTSDNIHCIQPLFLKFYPQNRHIFAANCHTMTTLDPASRYYLTSWILFAVKSWLFAPSNQQFIAS